MITTQLLILNKCVQFIEVSSITSRADAEAQSLETSAKVNTTAHDIAVCANVGKGRYNLITRMLFLS